MPNIQRRTLAIACMAAMALAFPSSAFAQAPSKIRRIGFINVGPAALNAANVEGFRAGLRELGHIEGRTVSIEYRWADNKVERLPSLVAELLALKPDVIVSTGGQPTIIAVKAATTTVPVVFITGEPVVEGLISSLSKPGGNLTGIGTLSEEIDSKRLALLKEILPQAKQVAVIWNPESPIARKTLATFSAMAQRLGITPVSWEARNGKELGEAFGLIAAARVDALVVLPDPVLGYERTRIVEFAQKNRLPAIYWWREFVQIGGLVSYGTNLPALYKRTATYVDKILNGAKPGDLPVEFPNSFELAINLKTAKALGLVISPSLLVRADEVIQ